MNAPRTYKKLSMLYIVSYAANCIQLEVVKLPEAKRGFVLLPRGWVVERSFAWAHRFRRLVRDYKCLPETVAGLHLCVFARLMLVKPAPLLPSP